MKSTFFNSAPSKTSKKNLTYPQAVKRFPKLNPFGDADKDGKLNMFDCKPFNRKRHSLILPSFGTIETTNVDLINSVTSDKKEPKEPKQKDEKN